MGQVVALDKPIEKLVLEIRGHVHDAGRAETTCAKHQLQAGWRLIALRKRIEAGEAGEISWWDWYDTQFTGHIKSRSYAEKLMRWANSDDPEGAIEAERDRKRDVARKARERDAEDSAPRSAGKQNQGLSLHDEYDIVEHALRLITKMDAAEREQFDEAYRSKFQ